MMATQSMIVAIRTPDIICDRLPRASCAAHLNFCKDISNANA